MKKSNTKILGERVKDQDNLYELHYSDKHISKDVSREASVRSDEESVFK